MGCGTSSQVVPSQDSNDGDDAKEKISDDNNDEKDDISVLMLPDTPIVNKAPIAFEIPLDDDETRRPGTPPPHLLRLLKPTPVDIDLPQIEEKLAVAEARRLALLNKRSVSAQKNTQNLMKAFNDVDKDNNTLNTPDQNDVPIKTIKNTLPLPTAKGACEGKNI